MLYSDQQPQSHMLSKIPQSRRWGSFYVRWNVVYIIWQSYYPTARECIYKLAKPAQVEMETVLNPQSTPPYDAWLLSYCRQRCIITFSWSHRLKPVYVVAEACRECNIRYKVDPNPWGVLTKGNGSPIKRDTYNWIVSSMMAASRNALPKGIS
jgi:hypothetical protein